MERKLDEEGGDVFTRLNALRGREDGFTLLEILIVLFLIGILGGIALTLFRTQQDRARNAATTSDLNQAAKLMENYYVKYMEYPGPDIDPYSDLGGNFQPTMHVVTEIHTLKVNGSTTYNGYCIVGVNEQNNRIYWYDSINGLLQETGPTPPSNAQNCVGVQSINLATNPQPGVYITEGPASSVS